MAEMFETVRHQKVPQQIIHQIRTAILEGRLKPGDRLPTELELTSHFDVSRQTLREAMRALEYLGLLEIRAGAGGGAFVSEVDMDTTKASLVNFLHFKELSIEHLSEIRKTLEPCAARLAAERMSDEEIETLREINRACKTALEKDDPETLRREEIRFHRTIAASTHNPILILILDFIENLLEDIKIILKPDERFSAGVVAAHEKIREALENRDPQRAAEEMFRDVSKVEEGLNRLAEGKPGIKWS